VLHYQPQVRVDGGRLVGIEALVRWPQADGSLVMPDDFIPVAEQRGLIMPIGAWVLRTACRQNRLWQNAGLPKVPIAVNLSAIQFKQKNLVEEVRKVLAETGLEPAWLAFDLTEGMLVADSPDIKRTLEGLQALGVKLAIDDFGTGHSSLAHLKRWPIDRLKIDRTFVRDVPGDADASAITGAVVDLARNLGITVVAEGVDHEAQVQFLRERGCEEMQGYLIARPMPAADMAAFLAERRYGTNAPTVTVPRSA